MLDAKVRQTDDARELSQLHTFLAHLNGKRPVRDIVHYVRYRCGTGAVRISAQWERTYPTVHLPPRPSLAHISHALSTCHLPPATPPSPGAAITPLPVTHLMRSCCWTCCLSCRSSTRNTAA